MYLLKSQTSSIFCLAQLCSKNLAYFAKWKPWLESKVFKFSSETNHIPLAGSLLGLHLPFPLALPRLDSLLVSGWGGHKYQWEQPLRALYGQPPSLKKLPSAHSTAANSHLMGTCSRPRKTFTSFTFLSWLEQARLIRKISRLKPGKHLFGKDGYEPRMFILWCSYVWYCVHLKLRNSGYIF